MKTNEIADLFKIEHRNLKRTVDEIYESGIFSQSEIVKGKYKTNQNKSHECFDLSENVVVYLLSTRRAFRDGQERIEVCSKLLGSMKIKHDVLIGEATRSERKFGIMLEEFFGDELEIIPQYSVCGYRIDFYIPVMSIAIEYDERHHLTQPNLEKDMERVNSINKYMKGLEDCGEVKWVRVNEGFEVQGIRDLMGLILHEGLEFNLNYLGHK